jgi:hypothetical protein
MFERYTEKARRAVFFARYEASQYGSPYIDTEYLLLGLIREDQALIRRFLRPTSAAADIRAEIERQIPPRERTSTSIEMPLTIECKTVLILAAEESETPLTLFGVAANLSFANGIQLFQYNAPTMCCGVVHDLFGHQMILVLCASGLLVANLVKQTHLPKTLKICFPTAP